jgi:hypothetical protein
VLRNDSMVYVLLLGGEDLKMCIYGMGILELKCEISLSNNHSAISLNPHIRLFPLYPYHYLESVI